MKYLFVVVPILIGALTVAAVRLDYVENVNMKGIVGLFGGVFLAIGIRALFMIVKGRDNQLPPT